ncbi:hypothetical protein EDC14_10633 [Hydrogenispora ethanolica]|uniref:Uncharacterized protein n=1 Tax=Hydrogenispora ethanolica TaxID=1082276 RepID=A0A4R1QLI0_HYDET|nr:hypothetical protein [Hydrogenispora ethanolica]TCL54486.1 hypothetical protein EDC14_10633 [Hydrogenispora ethanolica]
MENNGLEWLKYRWILGLAALAVFGWGCFAWVVARSYQPELPEVLPPERSIAPQPGRLFPLQRYEALQSGALFFAKALPALEGPLPVAPPPPQIFHSKLVLWGLIKDARQNWAVVGNDLQSSQDTRVVKAGDTVAGEQIIQFGERSIRVKNSSGEGWVELKE